MKSGTTPKPKTEVDISAEHGPVKYTLPPLSIESQSHGHKRHMMRKPLAPGSYDAGRRRLRKHYCGSIPRFYRY